MIPGMIVERKRAGTDALETVAYIIAFVFGGIINPIGAATASTEPIYGLAQPHLIMRGNIMLPTAVAVAISDPVIVPKNAAASTMAEAIPPFIYLRSTSASITSLSAIVVAIISLPARINKGIVRNAYEFTALNDVVTTAPRL